MSSLRIVFRRPPFRFPTSHPTQTLRNSRVHELPLPLQSRIRWSYVWYAGVLALGITTGLGARQFAAPLGLLEPNSPEDKLILQSLGQDVDNLEIVKTLRKQSFNLHSDTAISGSAVGDRKIWGKGWVELEVDSRIDAVGDDGQRKGILGVMSGTRGLGVERAFWNAETKEMVAVIWIGGGLAGWPGVAHGGAIATIFEETMARMVKGPEGSIEPKHRPTSLSLTYAKPTYTLDFYILRASFSTPKLPQSEPPPEPEAEPTKRWLGWLSPKDLTKQVGAAPQQTAEIIGTLENVKGTLCVKAKASFEL